MTSDSWTLQWHQLNIAMTSAEHCNDIKQLNTAWLQTALVSRLAKIKTLSNGNCMNVICSAVYFTWGAHYIGVVRYESYREIDFVFENFYLLPSLSLSGHSSHTVSLSHTHSDAVTLTKWSSPSLSLLCKFSFCYPPSEISNSALFQSRRRSLHR